MFHHVTVMKEKAVSALHIQPDGVYVDCTLGGAGHSEQIASRLSERGLLIGLDQDDQALAHAENRMSPYLDRVRLVKRNFRYLKQVLQDLPVPERNGVPLVNGVLYDLGVSSPQLDEAERGFSYNHDAPLDMRMDRKADLTAADIVNQWEESELRRILWQYGEEKFSKSIAKRIVQARSESPITTTGQLAELIKQGIPAAARRTGGHPAKRSFQAIRIAVNDELGVFEDSLEQAIDCLQPGGRVAVITFHSLEDRICKQTFAKCVETCTCPPDFPVCVCKKDGKLKLVNRKPWTPDEQELHENPRARSAKLRAAEKL